MKKNKKQNIKVKKGVGQHGSFNKKWIPLIIFIISFVLYSNTLGHEYTQDDPIVITENAFTTKGVAGISGLLSKDTFYGYFQERGSGLVAGGRYRPLSLIMFAIEYEIFGENPFPGHLINVLLYGLLGILIYYLLLQLADKVISQDKIFLFALIGTLIYILHPVHTEAVANIKGRDEILAMLLGASSWLLMLSGNFKSWKFISSGVVFFFALMAKENAIMLLPVMAFGYWFLRHGNIKNSLLSIIPIGVATIVYLGLRFSILGNTLGNDPMEMMNNPFVKFEDGQYLFFTASEKWATIMTGLGAYLKLLLYPHPLTNDYYPRAFEVMQWTDWQTIFSVIAYLTLMIVFLFTWKRNRIISFGIIYYMITILIFSNIFFPIGTHISERFLFMPSLGFSMVVAYVFSYIYYKNYLYVFYIFAFIIIAFYGVKTIQRNGVWKNNFTLFTTDVRVSNNSAKALNAAGGALTDASQEVENEEIKSGMLADAKKYLEKALTIHPNYKNAWLILGNVYYYQENYEKALNTYDQALSLNPNYEDAKKNKALVLRVMGREAGEMENDLAKSYRYLRESFDLYPQDLETIRLLGVVSGISGNHQEAIKYFKMFQARAPENPASYVLLYEAYMHAGNKEQAEVNRRKALSLDPNAFEK